MDSSESVSTAKYYYWRWENGKQRQILSIETGWEFLDNEGEDIYEKDG